ncbi:MAG: hypothetical protein K5694_03550 [Bacilli bacterium]|nr:hypothetical protein [Bacilli bacterium]
MGKFLKNFGIGLIYFLLIPVFLLMLLIAGIYGIFQQIVLFFIRVVRFFRGKDPFPPFEEEIAVQKIKESVKQRMSEKINNPPQSQPQVVIQQGSPQPQQVFVQHNYYNTDGPTAPPPFSDMQKLASQETPTPIEEQKVEAIPQSQPALEEPTPEPIIQENKTEPAPQAQPQETPKTEPTPSYNYPNDDPFGGNDDPFKGLFDSNKDGEGNV